MRRRENNHLFKWQSRHKLPAAAAIAFGLLAMPCASRASVVTFAQFQQATGSSNANVFAYLDNGATSDAELVTDPSGVVGGSIPVTFTYLSQAGLPADLQGPQQATLTFTASTTEDAESGDGFDYQIFNESGTLQDVLTITRDTPAAEGNGSRTDLLTAYFYGALTGVAGFTTPQFLAGDEDDLGVEYLSDFFNFGSDAQEDFNLAFSSWTTDSNGDGLQFSSADDYFASATAAGVGTFDVDPTMVTVVPEPASLMAVTIAGLPILLRRRRRML